MSGFTYDSSLPSPTETVAMLQRMRETQQTSGVEGRVLRLPYDFTTRINPRGLTWLYRYGITDEEIAQYNFGMSPSMNRLILPVYEKGELIYWQGRNLGEVTKDNPKYLNMRAGGRDVIFSSNNLSSNNLDPVDTSRQYTQRRGNGGLDCTSSDSVCVLVEDILSAIKVGRIVQSIALLGSYIPESLYRKLHKFSAVKIWLDYDKLSNSIKYSRRLSSVVGVPTRPIITTLDPKEYTTQEIKEILQ